MSEFREAMADDGAKLDRAQRMLLAGQQLEALAMLETVEPGSARWAMAQNWRAAILRRLSRPDEALVAATAAVDADGGQVAFVNLKASLLVQAGQLDRAEAALHRAMELGSDNSSTYLHLAYLQDGNGRHEEAAATIRKGLSVTPDDPSLVAHLGRFLFSAGRVEEADAVLAHAAQAHATRAEVHLFRGWVQRARGDLAGAEASLRRAVELDDTKPDWLAHLAIVETERRRAAQTALPIVSSQEAVRLVIWDLDDTFWRGTVTEGGIREYVQAHHDVVIELARRGIMSSICSKNDQRTIRPILEERGIAQYFIFPSISWEAKGPRIQALIEAVQLRPATVMFIDDNHLNRAEAARMIPQLQVEDEHFIVRILEDPRFKGKDDSKLSRLSQYKLLERRKEDEVKASASAGGSNEDFLRGCDIRVHIEYDVPGHLDRAIELVNRTNQLNFTKRRLPENLEAARAALKDEIRLSFRQAGLVRVTDRYGDYGFVGFFVTQIGAESTATGHRGTALRHFCFSCRTLGMLVEKWVYDHLGQPELRVVGEVLTDVSVPRSIDWITLGTGSAEGPLERQSVVAPEIRILGGCEANPIGFYLNARCPNVVVRGNFAANGLFFRLNGVDTILSYADRTGPDFLEEAVRLGMPGHLAAFDLFGEAPAGTALVVNCSRDFGYGIRQFRHRKHGWVIAQEATTTGPLLNLVTADWTQLRQELAKGLSADAEMRQKIEAVAAHMRHAYVWESEPFSLEQVESGIRRIIARVQPGKKLVFLLNHHVTRDLAGRLIDLPTVAMANDRVRGVTAEFPFVGTVSFGESILNEEEIQPGGNHYDRGVYLRVADAVASCISRIHSRVESGAAERKREVESGSIESAT